VPSFWLAALSVRRSEFCRSATSRKARIEVAVLITSCHVSTLANRMIVGSHRTTSAAEIVKNVAPLAMSDTLPRDGQSRFGPALAEECRLCKGARTGVSAAGTPDPATRVEEPRDGGYRRRR
jgi:hypothetical protein